MKFPTVSVIGESRNPSRAHMMTHFQVYNFLQNIHTIIATLTDKFSFCVLKMHPDDTENLRFCCRIEKLTWFEEKVPRGP